ncbi:hypothetical protein [Acutalibacter caecimuris]|uniref:hypothetical protein n=1 Tax=Acutalibacter caecimuris TaxID=3093657 RepID=UPI002AC969CC|nr:hypothetical protein [Acutalibacter sp. M00118]
MRITQSSVSMYASRSYQSETTQTLTHLDRGQGAFAGSTRISVSTVRTKRLEVEGGMTHYVSGTTGLPEEPAQPISQTQTESAGTPRLPLPTQSKDWLSDIQAEVEKDPRIQILRKMVAMLESITGKKFSKGILDAPRAKGDHSGFAAASASYLRSSAWMGHMELSVGQSMPDGIRATPLNGYWTRQTVESGFVKGEEHTAFTSAGTAVTADGRTINFGMTLEMSRSFEAAYEIVGKEEIFTDPLVINLDTDAASLSDVTFYFDLDADGKEEEISTLGRGSGFLALDKNGDGKINDGSELFGAKTGNGFAELAQYDQDGNGWIDEGDEVFSKLSVWMKCGSGEAKLISLKDAGVGAIFLGSQGTQFSLTDASGSENARIRRTGLYLKENGQAGTVQHVDFKA